MRRILVTLILLLITLNTTAQDTNDYRLRRLDSQEYIQLAFDILSQVQGYSANPDYLSVLIVLVEQEFDMRYGDTADAELLSEFYANLVGYGSNSPFSFPYYDPLTWNRRIVDRWLTDNPTDFTEIETLEFDDYKISIIPNDFNGDGETDWLLYVRRTGINFFQDYWLAQRDTTSSTGYLILPLPVPFHADGYRGTQLNGVGVDLQEIRDVNSDGIDELVFKTHTDFPASWNSGGYTYLYLMGWHEDQMVIFANPKTYAQYPEWSFKNLDADSPLELVQLEPFEDNWLCVHSIETVYDWDGTRYQPQEPVETWTEDVNCALRFAEEAMSNSDYETTISNYQLALDRFDALQNPSPLTTQFAAYAEERLVIAYALADRLDEAIALIQHIRVTSPSEETIAYVLANLVDDDLTTFEICQAAYEAAELYIPFRYEEGEGYRGLPAIGYVDDTYYGWNYKFESSGSTSTGCDLGQMERNFIMSATFSFESSPLDQLDALGISVTEATSLSADLNDDGHSDWLIWLPIAGGSRLFVSDGTDYTVSHDYIYPRPGEYETLTILLPNGRNAWVIRQPEYTKHGFCEDEDGNAWTLERAIDKLDIWQLQGDQLARTIEIYSCVEFQTRSLEDMFRDTDEIHAWRKQITMTDVGFVPATFVWDDMTETYRVESELQPTPTTSPTRTVTTDELWQAIHTHDYQSALEMIDELLLTDTIGRYEFKYLRALTLEQLGRDDEALDAYLAIMQAAPGSPWAMLAGLHVESVD